jgi:hypothetical protein
MVDYKTIFSVQFLVTAVLEAKEVICDIQNSLDEQKQLLAFFSRQQEEVDYECTFILLMREYFILITYENNMK